MSSTSAAPPSSRTFPAALRAFRVHHGMTGVALGKLSGVSARSLSRWERRGGRPRDAEVRMLVAAIAKIDYPSAAELAGILGITPPPAPFVAPPAPPPQPDPVVEPPKPPPIPDDLVSDPMEVAVFRAAEALGISPTPLRPVLARFLGHVGALGLTPAEALLRLG